MRRELNYISQLTAAIERLSRDDSLNASHVSLYIALFYQWNINRFTNPISICRTDTMAVSKIGSKSTYHKCLRDLNDKGYLVYIPSHNPMKGSLIEMSIFETSTETTTRTSSGTTTGTSTGQALVPSINSINNTNYLNITNNKRRRSEKFHPPTREEVMKFFNRNPEGDKFFDHFESNGWLVGGKAKMKNWQAAARNWIKRVEEYKAKSNYLHTTTSKDYSEPL